MLCGKLARYSSRRQLIQSVCGMAAASSPCTLGSAGLPRPPVVFIVGTTGAGKTKLAVDVAKAFGGEVVNGDAIQMHTHLNIASAKATVEEASGVPHHLFSFLTPNADFTVRDFRRLAKAVIERIHARGKLPVVAGGTMYYAQALLSDTILQDSPEAASAPASLQLEDGRHVLLGGSTPSDEIIAAAYAQLQRVDPATAGRLHPRDWRKICRGLEVLQRGGKAQSQLLKEQATACAEWSCPYTVRVLWPETSRDVLTQRLSARVDGMVQAGLVQEVQALQHWLGGEPSTGLDPAFVGPSTDTLECWQALATQQDAAGAQVRDPSVMGALQAIGFKEFAEYLGGTAQAQPALLETALDTLKTRTRQYAMKQLSWIRNRFIRRGLTVHRYDSSDAAAWKGAVQAPAFEQVRNLLAGKENELQSVPSASDAASLSETRVHSCELCGVDCVGEQSWERHLASSKHKRRSAHSSRQPKAWLAMFESKRSSGMSEAEAEAAVREVPHFASMSLSQARAAATGDGHSAKRRRRE